MKSLLILFLTLPILVFGQENQARNSFTFKDEVQIMNAPNFYANYFSEVKINEDWSFRSEITKLFFEDKTQLEFPFLLKYNVKKNTRLLFGPRLDILKEDGNYNLNQSSLNTTIGLEQQLSPNLTIDTRYNYRVLGESPPPVFYSSGSRSSFKLGSRLKF